MRLLTSTLVLIFLALLQLSCLQVQVRADPCVISPSGADDKEAQVFGEFFKAVFPQATFMHFDLDGAKTNAENVKALQEVMFKCPDDHVVLNYGGGAGMIAGVAKATWAAVLNSAAAGTWKLYIMSCNCGHGNPFAAIAKVRFCGNGLIMPGFFQNPAAAKAEPGVWVMPSSYQIVGGNAAARAAKAAAKAASDAYSAAIENIPAKKLDYRNRLERAVKTASTTYNAAAIPGATFVPFSTMIQ